MINIDLSKFDPVIHSPVRIAIMSTLISVLDADFLYLKKITKASDGNLSSHISKLEKNGFLTTTKSFLGKKPHSNYKITKKGRTAFQTYLKALEDLINISKNAEK